MNKQEFLSALQKALKGLPKAEVEERLNFYGEMIDDRMEEGLSEEAAVAEIGSAEEIAQQILSEIPLGKLVKEKIKGKKRDTWKTVLIIAGSPVWLSLLIAAFAVVLSLFVSLWAVVICLWSVPVSLMGCAVGLAFGGIVLIATGNLWEGLAALSAAMVCAGLGMFLWYGCVKMTKGAAVLTTKSVLGLKKCFVKKEETE